MNKNNNNCPLCLNKVKSRPSMRLNCGHKFHKNCMHTQLTTRHASHNKCGMCRKPLPVARLLDEIINGFQRNKNTRANRSRPATAKRRLNF